MHTFFQDLLLKVQLYKKAKYLLMSEDHDVDYGQRHTDNVKDPVDRISHLCCVEEFMLFIESLC